MFLRSFRSDFRWRKFEPKRIRYRSIKIEISEHNVNANVNVVVAKDKELRQDISQLGMILSRAIRGESLSFFESVEKLRVLGHEACFSKPFSLTIQCNYIITFLC